MRSALVFGCGAVGLGIAASLADRGWDLCLVAPKNTARTIAEKGFSRTGLFRPIAVPAGKVAVAESFAEVPRRSFDHVLVCTKAFRNAETARELDERRDLLGDSGLIVLFQNGWGADGPFVERFGAGRVYNGRVITGFSRPAPNVSEVTVHSSAILVGSLHGAPASAAASLAEDIDAGGIPCSPSDEIGKALWAKLLYNCALNPLGAVLGADYGTLVDAPSSVRIMDRVIDEIYAVMRAEGRETYWPSAEEYRPVFYGSLVPPTRKHRSSTLQDVEAGRRTEIDTLSGAVVALGRKHGIPVPSNEMLLDLVKSMERPS